MKYHPPAVITPRTMYDEMSIYEVHGCPLCFKPTDGSVFCDIHNLAFRTWFDSEKHVPMYGSGPKAMVYWTNNLSYPPKSAVRKWLG